MIERHITFNVHPDKTAEFERFFADEYRPPVLDMPGLIECSLLREADTPTGTRWSSASRMPTGGRWRRREVHQALQPALNALHAGMEIVAYTKVA